MSADEQIVDGARDNYGDLQRVHQPARAEEVGDDNFAGQPDDAAADIAQRQYAASASDARVDALLFGSALGICGWRESVLHSQDYTSLAR